jgi:hypothetical protein
MALTLDTLNCTPDDTSPVPSIVPENAGGPSPNEPMPKDSTEQEFYKCRCNRCDTVVAAGDAKCPKCGGPEYRLCQPEIVELAVPIEGNVVGPFPKSYAPYLVNDTLLVGCKMQVASVVSGKSGEDGVEAFPIGYYDDDGNEADCSDCELVFERFEFRIVTWVGDDMEVECSQCDNPTPCPVSVTITGEPDASTDPCSAESADDHYAKRIESLQALIADHCLEIAKVKSLLKALNERYKADVTELQELIDSGPERHPLFDDTKVGVNAEVKCPAEMDRGSDTTAEVVPAATSDPDSAWRATPIESLGLSAGLCKILRECPDKTIATLGDIADWTASGKMLTDIPKIGEAKAVAIEEATEKFWAENSGRQERTT